MDDTALDPAPVLAELLGRRLRATEVYTAFGYHKSAYYKAVHEGRLITAHNVIRAARYFALNPVELQVRFGLIRASDVTDYVAADEAPDERAS